MCSSDLRVVAELGGAVPYRVAPAALAPPPFDPAHPMRSVAAAVLRTCCVGESLSVPLLAATRNAAGHPLVEAVLARLVEDEGPHAQLGWLFFEWAELDDADRMALGAVARAELEAAAQLGATARSVVTDGVTSEGWSVADIRALGWLDTESWRPVAERTLGQVRRRLEGLGIPTG